VVRRGLAWSGVAWSGQALRGKVRRGTVWRGSVGHGLVWSGLVWSGFCEVTNDHMVKTCMAQMVVGHRAGKNASATP